MPAPLITEDQVKARILAQVGDTPKGDVAAALDLIWAQHAPQDAVLPGLRALYTERDALKVLLGVVQRDVDQNDQGVERRQGQTANIVLKRITAVQADIARTEKQAGANRPGAFGLITRTAPITVDDALSPPTGPLDANDSRISGSPYAAPFSRRGGVW